MPRGIKKTAEIKEEVKTENPQPVQPSVQVPFQAPASTAKTDRALKSDIARMEAHLASQAKVNFVIPLFPGESPNATEFVSINGWKKTYPKGVLLTLPMDVARLLADSYRISMQGGEMAKSKLLTGNSDKEQALG